jgi:nitrogen fixation/metabolism regulation signal transduction histidine kinase
MFDRAQAIDTVNPGATRILRAPVGLCRPVAERRGGPGRLRRGHLAPLRPAGQQPGAGERDHWQESFELPLGEAVITLLVRGAKLPGRARLVVFDDITELVSAQRSEAWGEVARRLAHEIKNPLTPIQLSAERLQFKLSSKLEGAGHARALGGHHRGPGAGHEAAGQRVPRLRAAAGGQAAAHRPQRPGGRGAGPVRRAAGEGPAGRPLRALPLVAGDATQLRQVIHNLVQNALDAVEAQEHARVSLETEVLHAEEGGPPLVRLKVSDNGPGFSEKVLHRAFEPYVTTKSKGTGLGLAVVKKIADEHGARVRIVNLPPDEPGGAAGGAQVSLSFSGITEQKDPAGPPAANPPATGS